MAEILGKLEELQRLKPSLHWFCDQNDNSASAISLDGSELEERKPTKYDLSTEVRRGLVLDCFMLFAYEGLEQTKWLGQKTDQQLERCHTCIVEYYKAKRQMLVRLRDEHEEQEVELFSKLFDQRDLDRIKRGLDAASSILRAAAPKDRRQEVLELPALMSIFEAMSCEAFLADYTLVREVFEEPFHLVQTNTRLKVAHYIPAVTVFLFDPDQSRCLWAMQTWSRYRLDLTKDDFDFAVRDPLSRNLALAFGSKADVNFVQRLWCGLRLIVEKLDSDLITHSLRAMEFDVFRLALEHLQFDTVGLRFLLQTIQKLLIKAPKDFWDAMGAISPTTFIEQVFNNPRYDRFTMDAKKEDNYEFSALKDMLSWIQPFMSSLQISHQPAACRALTFQLMERLQAERFPVNAQIECYHVGLAVLTWTLTNCNREDKVFDAVGRVVAADTLEITSSYIKEILLLSSLSPSSEKYLALADPGLRVIRSALALECKSLRTDQEVLQRHDSLPHGFSSYSPAMWDAVVRHLDRGNVTLAKAALAGIIELAGLEKFVTKGNVDHLKQKSEFNVIYGHLTHLVCQMLERLNDFRPEDLDKLYNSSETAIALVTSLFAADPSTYEAGVSLTKSISGQFARKEAIRHLLLPFFENTLNSFSWSVRRIARKRTFASCPRMLKTCTDVLDILCDSQDGLLRIRQLLGISEVKAIENFWEHQWEALRVIYEMTEEWHRRVGESAIMKDFCRDTMQFSEHFFDQYSIFASAINSAIHAKDKDGLPFVQGDEAGKALLKHPAQTMESMVKWLRLRDEYLASTSVKLITKVLNRLSEWKMGPSKASSDYLEQVASTKTRTILTLQEKAELARALEANLGRPIITTDTDQDHSDTSRSQSSTHAAARERPGHGQKESGKKFRPGTIDLEAWSSKARKPSEAINLPDDDEFDDSDLLDEDILSVSRSVELLKQHQLGQSSRARSIGSKASQITPANRIPLRKMVNETKSEFQKQAALSLFKEKRDKEKQAKIKRDAEALARVKGSLPTRGVAEQTSGEGSVLSDLGIKGKDHAPKGAGMMVSSGSDTDSDDELDQELFGGASKGPKISAAVKEYNASKLKQMKTQGPIKKTRQVRSAKDMRARLAPDLSTLHRIILGWDFFHNGDFPPNSDRNNYSLVTGTFRTPLDYQTTFEPLLILEAWQGFLKSKEDSNYKAFEIKVMNRLTVDSFIEVGTTMTMADGKEIGISEADIILMSKAESPATDARQPHCLARVCKITRKKAIMEITYRVNVGNGLISAMVPNMTLHGVKISSITPLERECGALLGLKYYDLCDEIVRAKASPLLNYTDKQIEPIASNYKVNTAQAKAVRSAIDNDAFTLIQGPPGSGKTKTIIAIVGALLTSTLRDKGVTVSRPQSTNGIGLSKAPMLTSKKLLVCAPSNAAVDELVMRLKQGVKTIDGVFHKVMVVRLGRSDAINANVLDVTLEELVNAKLNSSGEKKPSGSDDTSKIFSDHKATSDELHAVFARLEEIKSKGDSVPPEMTRDIEVLKRKKQELGNRIDLARDSGHTAARDADISRRKMQQEILDGSHVICATLSGSGHEMFQNLNIEFETVIIDEAAQSIELSALIPLKYGCAKCIMVGDPKQLPPTVLSREAARFQYEQSLFVRIQTNQPNDVHLLDTQYRMHPEISHFPSQAFYDGRLLDGPDMARLRAQPWHESKILGPYRFFNVEGTHQSSTRGHSLINVAELEVALQLFERLTTDCKGYDFTRKVGIITPYKSQLRELRSRFAHKYGDAIFNTIEFNTTDAFQGRESEIIIFSCVRASVNSGIGFLSDIRRMNVGITRARSSLWVLGNSQSLMKGEFWSNLIKDAKSRDRYTDGNVLELLRKPLLITESAFQYSGSGKRKVSVPCPDIEMPDAPSSRDQPFIDCHVADSKDQAYLPSGGNGLNTNAYCDICGSFQHTTAFCDNTKAKTFSYGSCQRCGDINHSANRCTAERCLECGKIGHIARVCTSADILTKRGKEKLYGEEARHKAAMQRLPEIQRRRQIGDHDRAVPKVKITGKSPPPTESGRVGTKDSTLAVQKRKREPSPPSNAPKGPRVAYNAKLKSGAIDANPNTSRDLSNRPNHYSTHSGNASSRDLAPTIRLQANTALANHPYYHPSRVENGYPPQRDNNRTDVKRDLQANKINQLAASINGGEKENLSAVKAPTPTRSDLVSHDVTNPAPPRKKKEVNPFIIPKSRKPRT